MSRRIYGWDGLLPSELLRASYWRGNIRPKYSGFSSLDLQAAEAVMWAYVESIGRKRGWIHERVLELEDVYGFKFVRGLAALMERRCIFTSKATVNPVEARHAVFAEVAKTIVPVTEEARRSVLEVTARKLQVPPEQLDEWLYADLDVEAKLESISEIKPLDLLKVYNLSLTQTLLFQATELSFTVAGNWQRVFRAIKYYGLMYSATRQNGVFSVKVDGATSLFRLTRRYGMCLAKVLPEILRAISWRIEAKILRNNRLLNFTLDSDRHGWLFPATVTSERFDSKVEEEFANKFKSLGSAWAVRREPEPLQAGASVMIPDFVFTLGGTSVYMEVVGFWTREYLKRKLEKLAEIRDKPLIVAVDKELACDKLADVISASSRVHLIQYKDGIPVREVLQILEPYAKSETREQVARLSLSVSKPVVSLKELAAQYNVAVEAVRQAAANVDTHVLVGDVLVERLLLEEVKQLLESKVKDKTPLPVVLRLLEGYIFPDPLAVVTYCGFQIKWRGLMPADATVIGRSSGEA